MKRSLKSTRPFVNWVEFTTKSIGTLLSMATGAAIGAALATVVGAAGVTCAAEPATVLPPVGCVTVCRLKFPSSEISSRE